MFKLTLIRHGETNANKEGILQGHMDTELSSLGVDQSLMVANRLRNEIYDHIFCSDLKRAIDTAHLIITKNEFSKNAIYSEDPRLRERYLDCFQGKKCQYFFECNKQNAKLTDSQKQLMSKIESLEDVRKRVSSFFDSLCQLTLRSKSRNLQRNDNEYDLRFLVVSHGGWLHECIRYIYFEQINDFTQKEVMTKRSIPNTSVTVLSVEVNPTAVKSTPADLCCSSGSPAPLYIGLHSRSGSLETPEDSPTADSTSRSNGEETPPVTTTPLAIRYPPTSSPTTPPTTLPTSPPTPPTTPQSTASPCPTTSPSRSRGGPTTRSLQLLPTSPQPTTHQPTCLVTPKTSAAVGAVVAAVSKVKNTLWPEVRHRVTKTCMYDANHLVGECCDNAFPHYNPPV